MVSSKASSTIPLDEQVLTTASYMAAMYYNALPLLLRLPPSSPYYASYLKLRETFEFQPKRSSENIHVLSYRLSVRGEMQRQADFPDVMQRFFRQQYRVFQHLHGLPLYKVL